MGDGFLSPGGSDEVKKVLEGIKIKDRQVLDIGWDPGPVQFYWQELFEGR